MGDTRMCPICEKLYITTAPNSVYCGDECRKIGKKKNMENFKEKERAAKMKKKKALTVTEIAVAARKEGMTYGQYVMKMGL